MKKMNAGIMLLAAVLCVLVVLKVVDGKRKEAAQAQRLKDAQQKALEDQAMIQFRQTVAEETLKMDVIQRELMAQEIAYLPRLIPSQRQAIRNRLAGLPKDVRDSLGPRAGGYSAYLDSLAPKAAELVKRGTPLPGDSRALDALDRDISAFLDEVEKPGFELEHLLAGGTVTK